jgi:hypothetical protein
MKRVYVMGLMAAGVACFGLAAQGADEAKVKLDVTLPKPMFVGTPGPVNVPNLDTRKGQRPDFMVPAGLTNVAKGKTVTASDSAPIIGELDLLTDGDKEGSDGSYVEFGPGTQWAQIDLGSAQEIFAIVIWHYHAQARVYHDVIVQVSDDSSFISGVTTVYNNDIDNSSGRGIGKDKSYVETNEGRLIDARGVKGRYVRLYSRGNTSNDLNHYVEVEVFGRPAK